MNFEYSPEIIESSGNENLEKRDYLELAKEKGITESDFLELVKKAIEQIEIIKPALEGLKNKIIEIEPDKVYLLSKGADLFLEPLKKYFEKIKIEQDIECYNDDYIKGAYLKQEINNEFVEKYFPQISDSKIIFVDETFSVGKGALAINKIASLANAKNIYYFAISQDRKKESIEKNLEEAGSEINPVDFENEISTIKNNHNFILNNCFIDSTLFSKDIGGEMSYESLDADGRLVTKRLSEWKYTKKEGGMPSPYDYASEEEIKAKEERSRQSFLVEDILEEMIYNTID